MTKLVKIYGERNTATNYLSRLLRLNLRIKEIPGVVPPPIAKLQNLLPGNEWIKDAYFFFAYPYNLGWKHTCIKPVAELQKQALVQNNDLVILTITKNPYSWLLSLHRNPYNQYYSTKPDFETFLSSPWKTVRRDNTRKWLATPVELWNIKNYSYLQLSKLRALNLTAEGILLDPQAMVDEISRQFAIDRLSGEFVDYDRSTKAMGKNREYYRDYYLNERWRDAMSTEAIEIINQTVDKKLMGHFDYKVLL